MAEPIEVLVVTVNYRSAALALRALGALETELASPEIRLSAVVVENASGDERVLAEGIERRFSHFARLVASPSNGGYGSGNNLGVRAAETAGLRPRYVHFLNPDTEVRPGAVLELVRFLEAHPRAGMAGGSFEDPDGTPWRVGFRFPTAFGELESTASLRIVTAGLRRHVIARQLGDDPVQVDWLSGASIMFRREVLELTGGFDEGYFLYFEETDLCLRACAAGWECWYVPRSRVMHACGQSTGLTTPGTKTRGRLPAWWFESRRRYFAKNHGLGYAALADLALLIGSALGTLRNVLKGEPMAHGLLSDLMRQSVLWPRNRHVPEERCPLAAPSCTPTAPALRR
jgi:GT2 family glycosyltransferase